MMIEVDEIVKYSKLISDTDDIIYIKDMKKDKLKSIVIPASYEPYLSKALKEIEYQIWLRRNRGLIEAEHPEILENVINDFDCLYAKV